MGNNTLATISNGQVASEEKWNQYKTAICTDFLPRNINGAPTSAGGNLGSSSYPWGDAYVNNITATGTLKVSGGFGRGAIQSVALGVGSGTWVSPADVYELFAIVHGGGGGSGSSVAASGGGGVAFRILLASDATSISYVVGSGGAGATTALGGNGSPSYLSIGGLEIARATGGIFDSAWVVGTWKVRPLPNTSSYLIDAIMGYDGATTDTDNPKTYALAGGGVANRGGGAGAIGNGGDGYSSTYSGGGGGFYNGSNATSGGGGAGGNGEIIFYYFKN